MIKRANFSVQKTAYSEILEKAIQRIRPEEGIKERCEKVAREINSSLKKSGIGAAAVLGGSIAKDTFLRNDYDCDVFVQFDRKKYLGKDISALLRKAILKFKPKRVNGSRDYFQFEKDSIHFEVVPVLKIEKARDAENIIDVSPMHVSWIKARLDRKKGLSDDVRLARAFCKGQRVYGAESYINGFSGHVIDILAVYYGGFINLLKGACKWKDKTVIDPENYHKGKALFDLNRSKTEGPLILIDPVQGNRNAAASLSYEKFSDFRNAAILFLKKPSILFFEKKECSVEKRKDEKIITVEAKAPMGKQDVVGCKLKKAFMHLAVLLEKNDFKVMQKNWLWDRKSSKQALFVYSISNASIENALSSKQRERIGPPVEMKNAVALFKKKYKNVFEKNGKVCATFRREFSSPEMLISNAEKKDSFLKGKVLSLKII